MSCFMRWSHSCRNDLAAESFRVKVCRQLCRKEYRDAPFSMKSLGFRLNLQDHLLLVLHLPQEWMIVVPTRDDCDLGGSSFIRANGSDVRVSGLQYMLWNSSNRPSIKSGQPQTSKDAMLQGMFHLNLGRDFQLNFDPIITSSFMHSQPLFFAFCQVLCHSATLDWQIQFQYMSQHVTTLRSWDIFDITQLCPFFWCFLIKWYRSFVGRPTSFFGNLGMNQTFTVSHSERCLSFRSILSVISNNPLSFLKETWWYDLAATSCPSQIQRLASEKLGWCKSALAVTYLSIVGINMNQHPK